MVIFWLLRVKYIVKVILGLGVVVYTDYSNYLGSGGRRSRA
jgi:hypothetical protein